jgi:hypothetical protein
MPPLPGFHDRGATVLSLETTYTEPPPWNGDEMAKIASSLSRAGNPAMLLPNWLFVATAPGVPGESSLMVGDGKDRLDLPTRTICA